MNGIAPVLLGIDTSTRCSTLAIAQGSYSDGNILAEISLNSNVTHSRRIITLVDRLMNDADVTWEGLDGIVVGLGPGSFTGLRIGMATAKGFAAASGKKLIGIPTLMGLAASCVTDKKIIAVLDARKKEVYSAQFLRDSGGNLEMLDDPLACSPEQLCAGINQEVVMVGDGAVAYRQYFQENCEDRIEFAPPHLNSVSAGPLTLLGGNAFLNGHFLDPGKAVPLYVRASDAELSLKKKTTIL